MSLPFRPRALLNVIHAIRHPQRKNILSGLEGVLRPEEMLREWVFILQWTGLLTSVHSCPRSPGLWMFDLPTHHRFSPFVGQSQSPGHPCLRLPDCPPSQSRRFPDPIAQVLPRRPALLSRSGRAPAHADGRTDTAVCRVVSYTRCPFASTFLKSRCIWFGAPRQITGVAGALRRPHGGGLVDHIWSETRQGYHRG